MLAEVIIAIPLNWIQFPLLTVPIQVTSNNHAIVLRAIAELFFYATVSVKLQSASVLLMYDKNNARNKSKLSFKLLRRKQTKVALVNYEIQYKLVYNLPKFPSEIFFANQNSNLFRLTPICRCDISLSPQNSAQKQYGNPYRK